MRMLIARTSIAAVVISALLTQISYAQQGRAMPSSPPLSPEEKAELERKRADEIATDKAYKSMIKQAPDSRQKVDPWATVRTPPAASKN